MKPLLKVFLLICLGLAGQVVAGGKSEAVIIDVRTPAEYQSGHVAGALNMPHTAIGEQIGQTDIAKDTPIKVYCASGNRAGMAKATLEEMGYSRVTNIGGYRDIKDDYDTTDGG